MLNSRVKLCSLISGSESWVCWGEITWGLEPLWRDGPYGRGEESVAEVERRERWERE